MAMFNATKKMLCTRCLHEGFPRVHTKGSFSMELLLWGCFAIPGLVYSLWRVYSRADVCTECGHDDLLPAASPRAYLCLVNAGVKQVA